MAGLALSALMVGMEAVPAVVLHSLGSTWNEVKTLVQYPFDVRPGPGVL
jgi:hypothetical protein